jgi:hypothetical protein
MGFFLSNDESSRSESRISGFRSLVRDEDSRIFYEKLAARFLKEEFDFDVEDVNSLSSVTHKELYEKLTCIECDDAEYTETEYGEDSIYSARGILASSLITEMGERDLGSLN